MKRELHPEFRSAFTTSKVPVSELASAANMPRTTLGRIMAAAEVRHTPLTERRLRTVAGLLWYPPERIWR